MYVQIHMTSLLEDLGKKGNAELKASIIQAN